MNTRTHRLAALMLALATLVGCGGGSSAATPVPTPVAVQRADIVADAVVLPDRSVDVVFDVSGTVAEILVNEGDIVKAGDPLARLDTTDLELQVAQSEASLAQSQASYDKIEAGATPEEIAAQAAVVKNAEANLQQTRTGNSTAADLAGAQAQLRQAEAVLAALRNPSAGDLSAAVERVRQAEINVQSTRDSLSQAKTSSELALQQSADALTQAQASYATAKENWAYVEDTGQDPTNPNITDSNGKRTKNKLNDVQKRQYYETFVQAEAGLRSAEKRVADAQVVFEQAQKQEVAGILTAESQLTAARTQLEALQNPDKNSIAQQQAAVDQARANVQKVQQGGTQASIAAAEAALTQQQANLEGLTVPARSVDLAEARGRITAAEVALKQAQRDLEQATLRAPFDGSIAERNLEVGQRVTAGSSGATIPFVLADTSRWQIKTDNLSEIDVVRFKEGSPAELTFEALPGVTLLGTVTAIKPRGADRFGDMTYVVTVTPDSWDERLRWNMSASVTIRP
jgi:HlyD family secretion protein